MCGILHPRPSDAQLLHDAVQEPLDVGFGHLVRRAGAAGWSQAELETQEEAEQRGAHVGHLHQKNGQRRTGVSSCANTWREN